MSAAQPTFQVACPQCGQLLAVPASAAGRQASCPYCQSVMTLPAVPSPAAGPFSPPPVPPQVPPGAYAPGPSWPAASQGYPPPPAGFGPPPPHAPPSAFGPPAPPPNTLGSFLNEALSEPPPKPKEPEPGLSPEAAAFDPRFDVVNPIKPYKAHSPDPWFFGEILAGVMLVGIGVVMAMFTAHIGNFVCCAHIVTFIVGIALIIRGICKMVAKAAKAAVGKDKEQ
jgi:hypothetical protein